MVLLRTGERLTVAAPEGAVEILTRYGLLKLKSSEVHALVLASDDSAVHQLLSPTAASSVAFPRFSPLTSTSPGRPLSKDSGVGDQSPAVSAKPADVDDTSAVPPANDDQLVGSLSGMLKLRTAYSTISLNGPEVRRLTHTKGGLHGRSGGNVGPDHAQW